MNEIKIFVKNLIVSDPLEAIDKLEALIIIQHNKRKDDYYRRTGVDQCLEGPQLCGVGPRLKMIAAPARFQIRRAHRP